MLFLRCCGVPSWDPSVMMGAVRQSAGGHQPAPRNPGHDRFLPAPLIPSRPSARQPPCSHSKFRPISPPITLLPGQPSALAPWQTSESGLVRHRIGIFFSFFFLFLSFFFFGLDFSNCGVDAGISCSPVSFCLDPAPYDSSFLAHRAGRPVLTSIYHHRSLSRGENGMA